MKNIYYLLKKIIYKKTLLKLNHIIIHEFLKYINKLNLIILIQVNILIAIKNHLKLILYLYN